jgi:autotransporter-associated beta strand protein
MPRRPVMSRSINAISICRRHASARVLAATIIFLLVSGATQAQEIEVGAGQKHSKASARANHSSGSARHHGKKGGSGGDPTWTGGGSPSVNWSTPGNWTPGAPTSGTLTDLVFAGSTNTGTAGIPLNNDIGGAGVTMTLNSIAFSSGGGTFFLGGNTLRLDGTGPSPNSITQNSSSAESIANRIDATGKANNNATTITLGGDGTGVVTLSGVISTGDGHRDYAITKTGTSTFVLSGANTYTDVTTINGGTLQFAKQVSLYNNTTGSWTATNIVVASGATAAFNVGGTGEFTSANIDTLKALGTATGGFKSGSFLGLDTTNASGGNFTYASVIANPNGGTNVLGLTKLGTGTLTLTGASTYTGATTINGGTLKLDNNNTTAARLAGTSGITVNSGGTLLLAQTGVASNDRINNSATMTLNGGTFNTGGLSEHGATNNTAGIGALTLQSTSIIDMGSAASIIAFANSSSAVWSGTLNIYNWSGTPLTGGGTDELFFGNNNTGLTATQLAEVQFFSGTGTGSYGLGALILANGEVVPIPEPGTWFAGGLALAALIYSQRRRLRR